MRLLGDDRQLPAVESGGALRLIASQAGTPQLTTLYRFRNLTEAAADGADVTGLSAQARADRVAAGQVEVSGVRLRDGNLAGRGDWIVTRLNDRRLSVFGGRDWVKNGDAWRTERRSDDGTLPAPHIWSRLVPRLPT